MRGVCQEDAAWPDTVSGQDKIGNMARTGTGLEPIPLYFQPIHWDLPFGKLAFTPLASRGSSTDFGP